MKTLLDIEPKLISDINSAVQRKSELEADVATKIEAFEKSIKSERDEIKSLSKTLVILEPMLFGKNQKNNGSVKPPKNKPVPQKGTPRGATKQKVIDFLKKNPKGASQTDIADKTGIAASYVNYLLRDKKTFLKQRQGRKSLTSLK
jgi:hypothetical protein